jgi:Flp pilus assembly protein TadG
MKTASSGIFRKIHRFARDRRGVSAVEFALLAPLMIGLYLGCAEVSDGVSASRKVSLISATLANLSAQVGTISTSDMTNIMDASTAIIAPYAASKLKMTITCLSIDATGKATVKWSATRNGTANTGLVRLYADGRLHDQWHADAGGQDVHEPARHGADLRRRRLHLMPL